MRDFRIVWASLICATGLAHAQVQTVSGGPGIDYQPSIIRSSEDGAYILVFERLGDAGSGDLYVTRSTDQGESWSDPQPIIASAAIERHPALLQLGPESYVLFYLKGTGSNSSFRISRASSVDGIHFTEQGSLNLGWGTGGEINPHVIRHADGRLTMSYQRLGGSAPFGPGSYVAQSTDSGLTWDTQRTQIAASSQLPRIAYRESDGLYLASYQTGSSALQMWVKTTTDPSDWSASPQTFASSGNHHDSLPVVMPDGAFVLFWIRAVNGPFDIAVRRSLDGINWSPTLAVTTSSDANDVEPHPLIGSSASSVELYWGRSSPAASDNYDIVRSVDVVVNDIIFTNGFDP